MNTLPEGPSRALVRQVPTSGAGRVETRYRVESDPGWHTVRDVLGILRRHLWLIVIITAVTTAAAAYLVTKEVAYYTSIAKIRLVDRDLGVGTQTGDTPLGGGDLLLSEVMVLTGRTVLGEAVDREGLRLFSAATKEPASFVENVEVTLPPEATGTVHLRFGQDSVAYGTSAKPPKVAYGQLIVLGGARFTVPSAPDETETTLRIVPRDAAIDHISSRFFGAPDKATGGVVVSFTSRDRRIAPRVVNAGVQVYQEVNAEIARQNVGRRRAFLEEQLKRTDSLLMVAQAGLSGLRTREQSYSAAGEFSVEQSNLMQVELQQAQMQADLRMYENALGQITQAKNSGQAVDFSGLMALPGLIGDPTIGQLYSRLVSYRTDREDMLAGPWARARTHPDVRRLDTLIASTETDMINAVRSHVNASRSQIAALGSLRGRALAKMSDLPRTETQEVYLTQNLAALEQMGNQLRAEYQEVRLEEASEAGQVEIIQLATRALRTPSKAWMKILLGIVVGLMLGSGAAVARQFLDDSVATPQEIEEILLLPNLAVIPESASQLIEWNMNGNTPRGTPEPPGTEAYRLLRTNLLFSQGPLKSLVVTSAAPGEGKTMTSLNLAAAYARQGLRVLLLECDLRRPALGKFFDRQNDVDLTSVLLQQSDWRSAVQRTQLRNLEVLLAGKSFPRAAEFLGSEGMKSLLEELSSEYDMVILDTSPLLVGADATVLGALVEGVLIVVRATSTDRKAVEQAVKQLTLVGANVVGTVLNDPEGVARSYGHYYDYSAEYETS